LRDDDSAADVAVVGLGYIGLVFAVALARAGLRVVGAERSARARDAVSNAAPSFFEPGLAEALAALPPGQLQVRETLDGVRVQSIAICVGTGYDHATDSADLDDVRAAVELAASAADSDTLVIVRSTLPVGACREIVLPALRRTIPAPLLAYCPERTIQGRALAELTSLPQVVGGIDDRALKRAAEFFTAISPAVVCVSSLEAAELVKLVCNAHTDVLYGFGNEVALIAGALGLSGREVIAAANNGYPRPDIAVPGYVGGSCLVKDPHLLRISSRAAGYLPRLIPAARTVNEELPHFVAGRVRDGLAQRHVEASDAKVFVCGIAYKGRPETDDFRGGAAVVLARALAGRAGILQGHDPVVQAATIAAVGYTPADLRSGLADAHVLVLLTDHPDYSCLDPAVILGLMRVRPLIVDVWGILNDHFAHSGDVEYLGFGHG
jgi:UDP-N-acetyl-D-mannosaminuronic acid dehydrogenase